jgi:hypothetical protein
MREKTAPSSMHATAQVQRRSMTANRMNICASRLSDGADVALVMIQRGYATPYAGGKRQSWCAWR